MTFQSFSLQDAALPPDLDRLREEVRDFLSDERRAGHYERTPDGWDRYDPDFSRRIGAKGWIGMTWPEQYGGRARTSLERYVVTEELLTSGAPVRAHWLADRQIGPLFLAYGSEEQKAEYLPRIAAGDCYFCAGLSEPDSGSDLSSIRTRAERSDRGWRVNGRKIWTSYAHRAHYMNLFARTSPRDEKHRHAGVSQFILDLASPGVSIRPIVNIAGDHDFNEVVFEDVFIPEARLIGQVGGAWGQVSTELAHERSGSERWVNSFGALVAMTDISADLEAGAGQVGRLTAHLWTLHRMSFAIAAMIQRGVVPMAEAALVKDLGTSFDQAVPAAARDFITEERRADLGPERLAAIDHAALYAPSHSIRGGTREILRGIIARELGLR
ncbi:acyl-CoA dehydrogenase [Pseudooceanicola nanhaiensis]|jgi:alkylation response protein AidB-like acyl-CoA dehydrogenase|uniref:Acyl-CoA dehydrogenase n=1 Tax=Pseudooceanicola nanhaiensis TaxID=375761 RepID=A0A917WMT6_9RHOB|nr:acyl-CoA dehydrogenase family protein [Pseudooceanicola nanhaiensis]GGM16037.1 acyl-CoA dehydrogenase [Pseudooceanicola nanhaiensis]